VELAIDTLYILIPDSPLEPVHNLTEKHSQKAHMLRFFIQCSGLESKSSTDSYRNQEAV
jgi:hypothetical protein